MSKNHWIKPKNPWIAVILYDPLAIPLVYFFEYLRISPTQITLISFIFPLLGAYFFIKGDFLIGPLCYFIWQLLDCIDGMLARKTNSCTELGRKLDNLSGFFGKIIGFISYIVYYFIRKNYLLFFLTIFLILLHYILRIISMNYTLKYKLEFKKPIIKRIGNFYTSFDDLFIIFIIGPIIFKDPFFSLVLSNLLTLLHLKLGMKKKSNFTLSHRIYYHLKNIKVKSFCISTDIKRLNKEINKKLLV